MTTRYDLTSTFLGLRLVVGLIAGAFVALPLSLWTLAAMAVARRVPAGVIFG